MLCHMEKTSKAIVAAQESLKLLLDRASESQRQHSAPSVCKPMMEQSISFPTSGWTRQAVEEQELGSSSACDYSA